MILPILTSQMLFDKTINITREINRNDSGHYIYFLKDQNVKVNGGEKNHLVPLLLSTPNHPEGEQETKQPPSSASQPPPMWPSRGGLRHLHNYTSTNPFENPFHREPCTSVMIFLLSALIPRNLFQGIALICHALPEDLQLLDDPRLDDLLPDLSSQPGEGASLAVHTFLQDFGHRSFALFNIPGPFDEKICNKW